MTTGKGNEKKIKWKNEIVEEDEEVKPEEDFIGIDEDEEEPTNPGGGDGKIKELDFGE